MTVSVIIPTYNRPHLLERAIASVRTAARGRPVPIIVVDDASTLSVPPLDASDITVVRQVVNEGPRAARNKGLSLVTTPWAIMLDDDDVLRSDAVETVLHTLESGQWESFAVIQFACSEGNLAREYLLADLHSYVRSELHGEFTPVVNCNFFAQHALRYPIYRAAGGESLLWWQIARDFGGIPTFRRRIVDVLSDAEDRLTSLHMRLDRSESQFLFCHDRLLIFGDWISKHYPSEYRKMFLTTAAYSWLSGRSDVLLSRIDETPYRSFRKILRAGDAVVGRPIRGLARLWLGYRRLARRARS